MSKSTAGATIQFARDTQSALNNVDKGGDIELENLNQSVDNLTALINENAETSLNDGFQTPPNQMSPQKRQCPLHREREETLKERTKA